MVGRDGEFYKYLIESLDNNAVLRRLDEKDDYIPVSCTWKFARMMEGSPEEFLAAEAESPMSTVHPDDRQEAVDFLKNRISKDGKTHLIIRKQTLKGNTIWVDLHYAFFEYDGQHYAYCNYFDVTQLKENEQRLHSLYESMNDQLDALAARSLTVVRANLDTGIVEEIRGRDLYQSDRIGIPFNEISQCRIDHMPIPSDQEHYQSVFPGARLREYYAKGEDVPSLVILSQRQNGRLCFVRYSITLRTDPFSGDLIAYGIESEYNSERVSEMMNQKILASQYDMISYISGKTYDVVIGDAAAIKKGNIFPKKRHGKYMDYIITQVIPSASEEVHDRWELLKSLSPEIIDEKLAEEEPYSVDVVCDIDGERFYKRFIFYSVEREAKFYILLKVDDTEIRKEQTARNEQLRQALDEARQANRAKTVFLSNMSHEIRTPMNAIISIDSIALKEPSLSERTREHLEKIGSSARHLLSLINDILDMSRIESGRMMLKSEEFSFRSMLEQINTMASTQCQERGLCYDCRIQGTVKDYYIGDDMKLKQVLINILGNAVKFTPAPGNVSFTVECAARFDDKATLRFSIKDTGIGMDKSYLPKIFDAFNQEDSATTNRYGGTGLGMAITKNIVDMMNGTIEVQSEKGKGTEFVVQVTLKESDRADNADTSDTDIQQLKNISVLVVDDDPLACEHARVVLEEVGVHVDTALSGSESLEKVRLHHARHDSYDLLLMDLHMPGQDGIETTRKVRQLIGHESAVIILTAYSWDNVLDEAKSAGVNGFISKPLFAANVLDHFRNAMRQRTHETKERPAPSLTGRHILLAEDMLVNAEITKEILQMKEMEVDHAENGKLAVDYFAKSPEGYYDAILMDIRMPVMDGLQATESIRSLERRDAGTIPIIAMTANAFDEDVQRSLQSGMNAHLSKPVEPEELYDTLAEMIGEREASET